MICEVVFIKSCGSSLLLVVTSLPNVSLYTTLKTFNGSIKDSASASNNTSVFDNEE